MQIPTRENRRIHKMTFLAFVSAKKPYNSHSGQENRQKLTCYERYNHQGDSVVLSEYAPILDNYNFDNRASSCCFEGIWLLYDQIQCVASKWIRFQIVEHKCDIVLWHWLSSWCDLDCSGCKIFLLKFPCNCNVNIVTLPFCACWQYVFLGFVWSHMEIHRFRRRIFVVLGELLVRRFIYSLFWHNVTIVLHIYPDKSVTQSMTQPVTQWVTQPVTQPVTQIVIQIVTQ